MTVPCPFTTRVPRKPYTTSASCGPAFRYSEARKELRRAIDITMRPTITQNDAPNPPRFIDASMCCALATLSHFLPPPHVRDSTVVCGDHDFDAFLDRGALGAPRAARMPRATVRIDQLAGTAGA